MRAMLSEVARTTPGVESVDDLQLDLDGANRLLTVTLGVQANVDGELTYVPFVVEVDL